MEDSGNKQRRNFEGTRWVICGGKRLHDETVPQITAIRELMEETRGVLESKALNLFCKLYERDVPVMYLRLSLE